jgi:hypothetical protein
MPQHGSAGFGSHIAKASQILALAITKRSQHNELVQFAKL